MKYEPNQKKFYEINGYYVDSTFFQLFDYDFKFGEKKTALNEPNTIILSEEIAGKFFGDADPVNKVIKVMLPFAENSYTVKGVFKETGKSHIPARMFLSMNNNDIGGWVKRQSNWSTNNIFHTYIKFNKATSAAGFTDKLKGFLERNGGKDFTTGVNKTLFIQPLRDIYLHSNFGFEIAPNGNVRYLYIFSSIAAFLLVIACINFMNLSTARSEKRAREVGLRKVIGAVRGGLVGQFLGESMMMSVFALVISFVLILLMTPVLNDVTGKTLSLGEHREIYGWLLALTLGTGLISGCYPAFYLSSFTPISVLKGRLQRSLSAVLIRKGLVVFQFTISMVLILGALLIGRQMDYLSSRSLGFSKNQKMVLPLLSGESASNYKILKDELANNAEVLSATRASAYPGVENVQDMMFYAEGKTVNQNVDVSTVYVDEDYVKTLGINVLAGRSFAKEFTADTNAVVLNETAVRELGYAIDNAVGRKIYYDFDNKKVTMNIIGVVKDYHSEGLQQEIKPLALSIAPIFSSAGSFVVVDLKTSDYKKVLANMEKTWTKINPNSPFEYTFLDQEFQKNYEKEERTAELISYFAFIAIFIACLGLFRLATFTAEQRTKEIGIRKVLGASVLSITQLLSGDFLKLVCISVLIASPLAWWAMDKWLDNFAFKTSISWQIFLAAGSLLIIISLATIGYQTIKAALMNPVRSLKGE
ncbi:ABC transporter permease [Dyadobacter luticola]|uniref:ABC transporter permease n=1 Tax=Dyadobacter luticola TaxID=1979387 RepID=UPI001E5118E0|nr:ABC transporter permease [Dyadobacter luticola]